MQLPSEIEAKYALPALRAFIAKKLVLEHGFTQEEAAKAIGLTQAAVSNYIRGVRGVKADWENTPIIVEHVEDIVRLIVEKAGPAMVLRRLNLALIDLRRKRVLCKIHKSVEPYVDPKSCSLCPDSS